MTDKHKNLIDSGQDGNPQTRPQDSEYSTTSGKKRSSSSNLLLDKTALDSSSKNIQPKISVE